MEGWLVSNFLAMIAYYKLYQQLKEQQLIGKESPSDIIVYARAIYKIKIDDQWHLSEITQNPKVIRQNRNRLPKQAELGVRLVCSCYFGFVRVGVIPNFP